MVSEYAIAEIEDLREAGYKLSLRQTFEINALGCAVEFGSPSVFAAPRVAKIGSCVLHELSIQAVYWFRDYAGKWWEGESLVFALAWANWHSRTPGFFKPWHEENKTCIQVVAWYRSLTCTEDEFNAAFNYVNRTERMRFESGAEDASIIPPLDAPDGLTDLVHDALATGIKSDVIMLKTEREVIDILQRYTRQQLVTGGRQDTIAKRIKNSAQNRFLSYVDKFKADQNRRNNDYQLYG